MSLASWLYLIALAVVVPILSARSVRAARLERVARLSRATLYANICLSQWVLAGIGWLIVRLDGQALADAYVTAAPWGGLSGAAASPGFLIWTAAVAAGGLLLFALGHMARHRFGLRDEEAALRALRPAGAAEKLIVVLALSPTAGICEEFLYRGFFLSRIDSQIGAPAISACLAAAVFGLAHLYQGWPGAARAGLIALMLAAPVVATGSVLPAMAAHAAIDAAGIVWLWPRLERRWPLAPGASGGLAAPAP